MPSKKKKYNARFPPARIKKIMQTDEDVGKVAAAVPVIISRALELFIESLIVKTSETTRSRNAKTLSPQHIKQTILSEKNFDFLKDLVSGVPDVQQGEDEDGVAGGHAPGENSGPKPRGRPRKSKDGEAKTPSKRKGRPRKKKESSEDSATESASQEEGGSDNDDETEEDDNTEEDDDDDGDDHGNLEINIPYAAAPPGHIPGTSWNGHPAGVHGMPPSSMPSTSTANHPYPPSGYPSPMTYQTGLPPPAHLGYSPAMGPPPMSYQYPVPPPAHTYPVPLPAHTSHQNMHGRAPPYGPPNQSATYMSPLPPHHVMSSTQQPNFDS